MKFHRYSAISIVITAILEIATSKGWAITSDSIEFTNSLLQSHSYILIPAERASLDEINRDLREAYSQVRGGMDPAERERATKRYTDAAARLAALLEGSAAAHRVVLKDGNIIPAFGKPFEFSSDEGAVLLRVESGHGDTQ